MAKPKEENGGGEKRGKKIKPMSLDVDERGGTPTAEQVDLVRALGSSAIDDVLREASLNSLAASRVVRRSPEFLALVREAIRDALTRLPAYGMFEDEEIRSGHVYPSGYTGPGAVSGHRQAQVEVLNVFLPKICHVEPRLSEIELPVLADGYFVAPWWRSVASTYGAALQLAITWLAQTRKNKFYSYLGEFGPKAMRREVRTTLAFEALAHRQRENKNALLVSAQFGHQHRGRSARRSCAIFAAHEFGLGTFEIACMLLTHPERLKEYDFLEIICLGDRYDDPNSDESFGMVPIFLIDGDGRLILTSKPVSYYAECAGSVTGYLF